MQRDKYKTVTVPILIPSDPAQRDGSATFFPGFKGLRPVRRVRGEDFQKNSRFLHSIGASELEEFVAAAQLLQAVKKGDRLSEARASVRLAKSRNPSVEDQIALEVAEKFATYSRTQLDEVISERVQSARLVIWRFQGKPSLAIYCPDSVTALFANALLSRVSGRDLAVCPHCGIPFVQKRPNQEYCSIKHREAHRVARWRASKSAKGRRKRNK